MATDIDDEDLMRRSPEYRRAYQEGYRLGTCEGRAQAIVTVLETRGIALRTADRDFILACTSTRTLDTWLKRALTVSSIRDLFDA